MPDHKFTRCPGCATVFRITAAQLALREGQVRCGHCRAVFDANDHFVALDDPLHDDGDADELARGRPTVTLRSADALQPVVTREAPASDAHSDETRVATTARTPPEAAGTAGVRDAMPPDEAAETASGHGADRPAAAETTGAHDMAPSPAEPAAALAHSEVPPAGAATTEPAEAPVDIAALDRAGRFEWKPRKSLRERPTTFHGIAIVLLLLAVALQAVLEFRDSLAAHAPFTRPILARVCNLLGCAIRPLRDTAALSIDASDLQADPAHRGLLLLSATIRNRAAYAIAYPYLELTLTDASDRAVVRRALAPADYAGGTTDPAAGIPGNGEALVKLFIDASATSQAGYRLYLFYP